MSHPFWNAFIKQAQAAGLDAMQIAGLYSVAANGGTPDSDRVFFLSLMKSGMDVSGLRAIVGLVSKQASDEGGDPLQESDLKEDEATDMLGDVQEVQMDAETTPMQDSAEKEEHTTSFLEEIQQAQYDGVAESLEEQEEEQDRGAGTDDSLDKMSHLIQLAHLDGFKAVMEKAAFDEESMLRLASLPFAGGGGGIPVMGGLDGVVTGVNAMGLAQLSQVDPHAASLAKAQLEADAAVRAMGPFEGMAPGAVLGGAGGAGLGALLGAARAGVHAEAPAYGILGGLAGAGLGAGAGGLLSQAIVAKQRHADAYKRALERYRAMGLT